MMTREDVLRELELLPVWTLRVPLPKAPLQIVPVAAPLQVIPQPLDALSNQENQVPEKSLVEKPVPEKPVEHIDAVEEPGKLTMICSDDKKWLFVLPDPLDGQSAELFNNILRALKIKPLQNKPAQNDSFLQSKQDSQESVAQVVIAMGEKAAQQLLNSVQPLDDLRGKVHQLNSMPLIVTYHPDQLLQHLPDKAKTWDDLCLALSVLDT